MDATVNDQPPPDDQPQQPDPTRADDFPTLAQRVKADVEDLVQSADFVDDELFRLTTDFEEESAVTVLDLEDEVPWSPAELMAQLNGIAATAYRIARNVRPLIELRTRHLIARADRERGRSNGAAG
jgi:hypothetical protein